jgi:uncharacterized iron-regulated membrane protein
MTVTAVVPPLAYGRQEVMVAALLGLAVAAVIVSLGAWVLLWRERRRGPAPEAPAARTEAHPARPAP